MQTRDEVTVQFGNGDVAIPARSFGDGSSEIRFVRIGAPQEIGTLAPAGTEETPPAAVLRFKGPKDLQVLALQIERLLSAVMSETAARSRAAAQADEVSR
jgi:hypothetical protein